MSLARTLLPSYVTGFAKIAKIRLITGYMKGFRNYTTWIVRKRMIEESLKPHLATNLESVSSKHKKVIMERDGLFRVEVGKAMKFAPIFRRNF